MPSLLRARLIGSARRIKPVLVNLFGMQPPDALGIIAECGNYDFFLADAARVAEVKRITNRA